MSDSDTQTPPAAWYMIKPEAAIFTDMILQYGIEGIIAQNIFNVEDYDKLSEDITLGFIFGYKKGSLQFQDNSIEDPDAANIVFTHQFIDNSCATLSLFNILFNVDGKKDSYTQVFLNHSNGMDANNRGLAFMVSPPFAKIHNSYDIMENRAKAKVKSSMNTPEPNNETPYHYITYIRKNDAIWELDNQKNSPVKLHSISSNGEHKECWLLALKKILCNKIETNALEPNLIAITLDPIVLKEIELKHAYSEIRNLETKLMSTATPLFTRKTSKKVPMSALTKEGRRTLRLKQKLEKNARDIKEELKQLRQVGSIEHDNISRRKFDYSSFIWGMLDIVHQKVPNLEQFIVSPKVDFTIEDGPSLSLQNSKYATNLLLKETSSVEPSSSSKKGRDKKRNDPTFVKRELPKRKCTENVIYSVKKVSIVPNSSSKKVAESSRSKVINESHHSEESLLPQKRNLEENQDEDSSNRGKRRYFLRK